MAGFKTIHQLLSAQAQIRPEADAIHASDRASLSYGSLLGFVSQLVRDLNRLGISRNDRVAIVVPNGPEMATAFLGVAAGATSAPLNPAYRAQEFEFYLSDLKAKALVIARDFDSPAREVARELGIPVLELTPLLDEAAGRFSFETTASSEGQEPVFCSPDDVALVLHTSGTTSKPKMVPLTHRNVCASAQNVSASLQLTDADVCLNVMPLFHIHGLIAAVLASLHSGASIACSSGFDVNLFFDWLRLYQPSWYTAVPTMHQSILAALQEDPSLTSGSSLRFLRSSSASLPPQVMEGLEESFGAPMIEAYGMTEAAHQMTSNPLPPQERRAGCVGIEAGPKVGIMDEAGQLLPAGSPGEIVIQGDNVTPGYENNPTANQEAFTNGWFRTGDEGIIDEMGYLTITGRLKEMVNRGGEKIAPREVDEALLDHPSVAQVVAFALPHPTLGEDLAAAVVLGENATTSEAELREYAFTRLADFKVPSQIVIVDSIPKGPTGKLQRIGLAEKLSEQLSTEYVEPWGVLQDELVEIWKKVLKRDQVGIRDNFFALGGDSLLAAAVVKELNALVDKELELPIVFQAPTIEQISQRLQGEEDETESYLVPVQTEGSKDPLFLVPGHGGDIFTYIHLARLLPPDQPIYVFRFPEAARLDNHVADVRRTEMAKCYVDEMIALHPDGPFHVGGFCYGAEVAHEMALLLHEKQKRLGLVAIIFQYLEGTNRALGWKQRLAFHARSLFRGSFEDRAAYLKRASHRVIERLSRRVVPSVTRQFLSSERENGYLPPYFPGKLTLFDPELGAGLENVEHDPLMGWKGMADELEPFSVPGDRYTLFQEPCVQVFAEKLSHALENAAKESK